MSTATETNGSPSSKAKGLARRIDNFKVAFHANRSVTVDGDLGSCHSGLRKGESAFDAYRRTRSLDYADFNGNSRTPLAPLAPSLPAAFRTERRRRNRVCRFRE